MRFVRHSLLLIAAAISFFSFGAQGEVMHLENRLNLAHEEFLKERRDRFKFLKDIKANPPQKVFQPGIKINERWEARQYPWRRNVQALIFWVGQPAGKNNPVANNSSAWNPNWLKEFGGVDNPLKRNGYYPANFEPQSNPFYVALPYNDLDVTGIQKYEAKDLIPWYWLTHGSKFRSVCQNRWIAVHYRGKICFSQWKDVGPKYDDDWSYVFKNEFQAREKGDLARILISAAIRDFLQLAQGQEVSWKFVESYEVPDGPWSVWK